MFKEISSLVNMKITSECPVFQHSGYISGIESYCGSALRMEYSELSSYKTKKKKMEYARFVPASSPQKWMIDGLDVSSSPFPTTKGERVRVRTGDKIITSYGVMRF
jgi:hypothetical protein